MPQKDANRLGILQERINQYNIRFPVAVLVEGTGYDKGYISAILKGKKPISDNFWSKFNEVYPEKIIGNGHPTPDLPPDTKALYERWLADKEKTQQQFHATNQGLIELLKNKLEEIAANLMTGQHQLKEQLFVVGEGLGQQLEGIALGLAAKEKNAKKDTNVSAQKRNTDGKNKDH